MSVSLVIADLVAVTVLVFALFLPRHGRRDLIVALLVVNVAVLAVSVSLASTTVGIGLGLGLFGVLSIIRLRSEELAQHEIAYYFASLALGLLAGTAALTWYYVCALMTLVLLALLVGDSPRLARRSSRQQVVLDHVHADEAGLQAAVGAVVGGAVRSVSVLRTDLVNDTMLVDVRYEGPSESRRIPGRAGVDR